MAMKLATAGRKQGQGQMQGRDASHSRNGTNTQQGSKHQKETEMKQVAAERHFNNDSSNQQKQKLKPLHGC
jgi:hypothetical protein